MKQREVAKRLALELVTRRLAQKEASTAFRTHPTDADIPLSGASPTGRPQSLYAVWCALCRGRYNCGRGRSLPSEGCDPEGVLLFEEDIQALFSPSSCPPQSSASSALAASRTVRMRVDALEMQDVVLDMTQRGIRRHCEPSKIFRALASSRTGELSVAWRNYAERFALSQR